MQLERTNAADHQLQSARLQLDRSLSNLRGRTSRLGALISQYAPKLAVGMEIPDWDDARFATWTASNCTEWIKFFENLARNRACDLPTTPSEADHVRNLHDLTEAAAKSIRGLAARAGALETVRRK